MYTYIYIYIHIHVFKLHPVSVRRFPSFRTRPLEKVLATTYEQNNFMSNPAPGENIISGNLVMETGCMFININNSCCHVWQVPHWVLHPMIIAYYSIDIIFRSAISYKIPFCQTPVGLSTCSMFGRALHRQPRVGSPQPQEKVQRPAGVRHIQMEVITTS